MSYVNVFFCWKESGLTGLDTSAPGISIAHRTLCVKENGKSVEFPDARLEKRKRARGGGVRTLLGSSYLQERGHRLAPGQEVSKKAPWPRGRKNDDPGVGLGH